MISRLNVKSVTIIIAWVYSAIRIYECSTGHMTNDAITVRFCSVCFVKTPVVVLGIYFGILPTKSVIQNRVY